MGDTTSNNIRNISVIAHIDHGKSTLTDSFVARAGLINADEAGDKRWTDNRQDEKDRGITIKSTGVSMKFDFEGTNYLVNLVDSPGHVDFSSEVSAALRITDGAIVVVDAVEGVAVQTETVLRQALAEQVKPILLINKMDRYIFELSLSPEEAYNRIVNILNTVNSIISTYQSENSELKLELSPELGNVFFGSGLHGWGFGLHTFSRLFAKKLGTDEKTFVKKLWGENYFDPDTKKVTSQSMRDGKPFERTFCKFVIGPVFQLVKAIMDKDSTTYVRMLDSFGVKLSDKDMQKPEKELYKYSLRKALPIADALLYGIVNHLPSPKQAQQYRYTTLYDGPHDDECAQAIKNCDPNGPLMVYISKMIPMDDGGRFYAFGRVFSGTVSNGQKVRILGANYHFGGHEDVFENKAIQRVVKMIGGKTENCDSVECGNTVALVGIDNYVHKTCTITTSKDAHPIKTMKFTVSPVVRVSVAPKNPADLPKLVEGLKKLSKSDPCVQVIINEDETIVAGVGELHVEICLNDLRNFMKGEIKVSDPVVPIRETILNVSSQVCLAKSPNKHNRLYMTAEPLDQELVERMELKEITGKSDVNARSRILVDDYNWDPNDSKKIWYFGPEGEEETNLVVDTTKGVQYLNEIKDNVKGGFDWAVKKGVLCEEPVRGVRFNLVDVTLHADAIHRGGGQIIPTARRVVYAAMLTAKPAIMEPMFLVEIQTPNTYTGTIYSCLNQKRGRVISEEPSVGNLVVIKGYLPVMESFGFNGFIRENSSGQAFPTLSFDHWEIMNGDPLDPNTKAGQVVRAIRKRKGLKEEIPDLSEYLDKL
ncbi:eukaryotic translation elongation factor 2 [Fadolivirus algeromassiliense]|jgi:elongation factor 2|uniref:Eukaryotic translation elongation factor 2 n=1 Tax=Fadolivirus FV1/VV64 TaxID=3070911 RepID=A0A7D3QUG4_9VIRU|nr:eukaryotic translation elongation factor 2 [Fadolivirus algeromassiliense]QKF94107.1 eukaryotic translation elongation factor 2 [Fadolivirus FV1/VV64]